MKVKYIFLSAIASVVALSSMLGRFGYGSGWLHRHVHDMEG